MKLFSPADTVDDCGDATLPSPSTCIVLPVQWPVWTRPGAGSSYRLNLRFVPPTACQTNKYQALARRCDAGKGSTEIILQSVHEARVPSLMWSRASALCAKRSWNFYKQRQKCVCWKFVGASLQVHADQARKQQQYQEAGMISVRSFTSVKWSPLEMSVYSYRQECVDLGSRF